jgi:hypothetical protein
VIAAPELPEIIEPEIIDPEVDPNAVDPNGEEGEEGEEPAWFWSWWTWNKSDGGGGGGLPETPIFTNPVPPLMQTPLMRTPLMQLPGQILTDINGMAQPFIDAVNGLATAASQLPFAHVTLPVIVPPGAGVGAPGGGGAGAGGVTAPGVPRINPPAAPEPELTQAPPEKVAPAPPARPQTSPPASPMGNELLPAPTYRMGYVDYLRAAGLGEVAAVAVPGVTGILVLTGAGGLIGYRQARAGRAVGATGPARFVN